MIRLSDKLRREFGCKVYKLALDGGMTCPNRDGTLATRGCIFCNGSGDFSAKGKNIAEQLEEAKKLVAAKNPDGKYIAYFQSFTNTYAPAEKLEKLFTEAISRPDIAALSVATRPDCLPDDVLSLLGTLAEIKPVWVELGLQTIHEKTAEFIRRGYPLSIYDDAVKKLHAVGAEVITHMIIGLPGETPGMAEETAAYIGRSGADGIKLQLLHVLRNTDLAALYAEGKVSVLTQEEYIDIVIRCLKVLPPDITIHRLTGDGKRSELIAPLWSLDKKRVLNALNRRLREEGL